MNFGDWFVPTRALYMLLVILRILYDFCCRIIDNMPVPWCYDVEGGMKYCNPGFPIGCFVTKEGKQRDACITRVSLIIALTIKENPHKCLVMDSFSLLCPTG